MREMEKPHGKRRSATWIGVFCVVVSVFAILLSIGMPGVGWVTAAAVLMVCSAVTPWSKKRYLAGSLMISLLHLFSFGPLTLLGGPASIRSWPPLWFSVVFVALPLMLAVITLLADKRYFKRSQRKL